MSEVSTFESRVIDEATELHNKIMNLSNFQETKTYHELEYIDRYNLRVQLCIMKSYYEILQARITRFK